MFDVENAVFDVENAVFDVENGVFNIENVGVDIEKIVFDIENMVSKKIFLINVWGYMFSKFLARKIVVETDFGR